MPRKHPARMAMTEYTHTHTNTPTPTSRGVAFCGRNTLSPRTSRCLLVFLRHLSDAASRNSSRRCTPLPRPMFRYPPCRCDLSPATHRKASCMPQEGGQSPRSCKHGRRPNILQRALGFNNHFRAQMRDKCVSSPRAWRNMLLGGMPMKTVPSTEGPQNIQKGFESGPGHS